MGQCRGVLPSARGLGVSPKILNSPKIGGYRGLKEIGECLLTSGGVVSRCIILRWF